MLRLSGAWVRCFQVFVSYKWSLRVQESVESSKCVVVIYNNYYTNKINYSPYFSILEPHFGQIMAKFSGIMTRNICP